eukprot:TRINITY_DN19373_c0_g3_i1.p1 TRINITY_DN19373_c0_g3~~TRINITY_DN19373_c0_g3_i1.p1  ORF type:complete len:586 (-),score=158.02 TRINITY_DN19373_c0_g3_i1:62-1819(-)
MRACAQSGGRTTSITGGWLNITQKSLDQSMPPKAKGNAKAKAKPDAANAKAKGKTKAKAKSRKPRTVSSDVAELLDRERWEASLTFSWENLIEAPQQVKNDPALVELCLKQSWKALEFASEELRNDPGIVLGAVRSCWWAFELSGPVPRGDQEVAMAAASQSFCALQYVDLELRADQEFMREAIGYDGRALRYASEELRDDPELVAQAVQLCGGEALLHAGEVHRRDADMVRIAMDAPVGADLALAAASAQLQADRAFVLEVVARDGLSLRHASKALRNDRGVVMAALAQNGEALEFASEELRESNKVVEAALQQNPKALRFADPEILTRDEELVTQAVQLDGSTLAYAGDYLRSLKRLAPKAVKQSWEALPHECVPGGVGFETFLDAVRQDWHAVLEILEKDVLPTEEELLSMAEANPRIVRAPKLRGNWAVAKKALEVDGLLLHYLLPELRADYDLVAVACSQNGEAFWEAHPSLRHDKRLKHLMRNNLNKRARAELRRIKAAEQAELERKKLEELSMLEPSLQPLTPELLAKLKEAHADELHFCYEEPPEEEDEATEEGDEDEAYEQAEEEEQEFDEEVDVT